jgi:hypothetical protein
MMQTRKSDRFKRLIFAFGNTCIKTYIQLAIKIKITQFYEKNPLNLLNEAN